MRQGDKELLKDLCARVPYHPKGHVVSTYNGTECDEWLTCATFPMFTSITNNSRLYLRPMSSMTEEEEKEICQFMKDYNLLTGPNRAGVFCGEIVDWLNAHHFDYRGLIEKRLAISTEEYNPYKS